MKRSYQQNCALADALDVIGERWTLLLVRELLIRPKRYGELLDNLAGIGTNLLAARLKELEWRGLIDKKANRYELTELGLALQPIIWETVRFGFLLNVTAEDEKLTRPEWDAVALRALYDAERGVELFGSYLFELDGAPFCIEKGRSTVSVSGGRCKDPLVSVAMSKSVARELAAGSLPFNKALDSQKLVVTGARREAKKLLAAFSLDGTGRYAAASR